jgi:hypothetical protein
MIDYEYYKTGNFKKVQRLGEAKKWRVLSNVRFPDIKRMVEGPEATVHICQFCKSTGFQLFEVKPPRSTRVRKKLIANCLECDNWFNLDKNSYK